MKTAEDTFNDWDLCASDTQTIQDNKQIQLDAMREGMRRAAEIALSQTMTRDSRNGRYTTSASKDILSAAEQLTEKAL